MSFNYFNINRQRISDADKKPGASDILYIAPIGFLDDIKLPVNDGTPGSTKRITQSHVWLAGKGALQIQCKAKSVEPSADAQGEAGGQVMNHKAKIIIKGDSPEILEFIEQIINEDVIAWIDSPICGTNQLVQLGSACTPAEITGFSMTPSTRSNGGFKQYEFTIQSADKAWYEGTLPEYNEPALTLGSVGEPFITAISSTGFTVNWADVPNAVTYTAEVATDALFGTVVQSPVINDPTVTRAFTGLTSGTRYWVRIRANAAGYLPGPYGVASVQLP